MGDKLLIDFDMNAVIDMVRHAFALNPNFSKRPNYLLRPNQDGTWSIVGLADSAGGPHYYPHTTCANCGQVEAMNSEVSEDKQLYEIYCRQCGAFCNYLAIYTPLPQGIDSIVEGALSNKKISC